jgi:hypothetical protein
MTQEQEELFRKDPLIKSILKSEGLPTVKLVGGAVIDILENRVPKDYDFELNYFPKPEKFGLEYQYETKTAKTFKKGDFILQQLKTDKNTFDFKISQASFTIGYKGQLTLELDENSFKNKTLIPTDICWTEKKNALNSLRRIIHWKNKGYTINDTTYLSLLAVVGKGNNYNS